MLEYESYIFPPYAGGFALFCFSDLNIIDKDAAIFFRSAPSALRSPNSFVLSETDISIVFITLRPPMIAASTAALSVIKLKKDICPSISFFNCSGELKSFCKIGRIIARHRLSINIRYGVIHLIELLHCLKRHVHRRIKYCACIFHYSHYSYILFAGEG
jgi:hypothetical protein